MTPTAFLLLVFAPTSLLRGQQASLHDPNPESNEQAYLFLEYFLK